MAAERTKIWDNFEEVCEIQKTDSLKYICAYAAREGVRYLNIREFYKKKTTGEWKPSMNGVAIPLCMPIVREPGQSATLIDVLAHFQAVINEALVALPEIELHNPDKMVWKEPKK